jgi:hypothetical protein
VVTSRTAPSVPARATDAVVRGSSRTGTGDGGGATKAARSRGCSEGMLFSSFSGFFGRLSL